MTTIGRVPEFDPSKEDFDYLERFERWLDANEIVDGKKANVFLSVLGPTEYRLLKSLVEPRKCVELTYPELTEAMSAHFKPKPILIAERFRFYRRVQNTGEPLADFINDLKKLASSCEFGQFLDDALRDRFVVGLAEEAYHRRLLTEKDLTFKKACDIALGLELAHKDTKELSGHSERQKVHKVQDSKHAKFTPKTQSRYKGNVKTKYTSDKPRKPCYRCGWDTRDQSDSRFINEKCHSCGKTGHVQRVCRGAKRTGKAHNVSEEEEDGELEIVELFTMYTAEEKKNGIYVRMELAGKPVSMQLDTGASVTILPEKVHRESLEQFPLQPAAVRLSSYTGNRIPVLGKIQVPVKYEGNEWTLPLLIVKGEKTALQGRNWLKEIKLNWTEIFSVNGDKPSSAPTLRPLLEKSAPTLRPLLEKHKGLFKEGYGTMQGFQAKLRVQDGAKPRFHKPRPVRYALKEAVGK